MSILDALIEQAKNPRGFVGQTMLRIMNAAHGPLTAWGLAMIHLSDTATVLDIGCGGGQTLKTLAGIVRHGTIYGMDYSAEAVATSIRENSRDVQAGKVIVVQGSVSAMPFGEGAFDAVTAFQTHYFWPDLQNDVREVWRVLRPGGQFLLVSELEKIEYHMRAFKTPEALGALLTDSGFADVRVFLSRTALGVVATK